MIDSTNRERIIVYGNGTAWPYVMVPLDQLEAVDAMLEKTKSPFGWTPMLSQ